MVATKICEINIFAGLTSDKIIILIKKNDNH